MLSKILRSSNMGNNYRGNNRRSNFSGGRNGGNFNNRSNRRNSRNNKTKIDPNKYISANQPQVEQKLDLGLVAGLMRH